MKKDHLITQVQKAGQNEARESLLFRHHLASKAKLHPTDLECLEMIIAYKQTTPGQLSQATGLSTGAMTAALGRLEKKKLITRKHSSKDRRKVIVEPILKHIQPIFGLYQPFVASASQLLEQYTPEQLETIYEHYRAMAAIYEQHTKR